MTAMNRIVVGVDGSKGADAALVWAAEEARLRNAHLEVVYTFAYPITGGVPLSQEVHSQLIAGCAGGARRQPRGLTSRAPITSPDSRRVRLPCDWSRSRRELVSWSSVHAAVAVSLDCSSDR